VNPPVGARRRVQGLLRNLRVLHRGTGTLGLAELVVGRALPGKLTYRRTAVMAIRVEAGQRHPELSPRRIPGPEPGLEAFYAQLAVAAEPRVPTYSKDELNDRFAAGWEPWVFHVGNEIVHALWVARDRMSVGHCLLKLSEDQRALEAGVTLPAHRSQGIGRRALDHLRPVMAAEGVTHMLGAVGGYNRRYLSAGMTDEEVEPLLTVHSVCLAGREWLRTVPLSPAGAALRDRSGLPPSGWTRGRESSSLEIRGA